MVCSKDWRGKHVLSELRVCVFSMSVHPDNISDAAGTNAEEVKSLLRKRSKY